MKQGILSALIALFVLGGIYVYIYHRNSVKSQEIAVYEQNWKAAKDSVEYYRLKNGELLAERAGYILSEHEACEQLNMSKSEIADLKKKLGAAVATISKIKSEVRIDSIYIESEPDVIRPDSIRIPFKYSDDWLHISGLTQYSPTGTYTDIYNIGMVAPLTVGHAENGKYFVTTSNPYLHITDITSVVTEKAIPKKSHWGFTIGVGPSVGYDFHHKDIYYGVGGIIGFSYKF